jgi:hypothetical protein
LINNEDEARTGVDVIGASPRVRRVISLLGLEWAFGLR